jgi:hypothetical protein
MTTGKLLSTLLAVLALMVAGSATARAGGDEYDASKDVENQGPGYFGFVRDMGGKAVVGAQVMLRPKSGEPVVIKSNVLGLYRSHVRKGVKPDDVTVSCGKDGYKQERVFRRTPPGSKDMFIETDCTLRKL